MKIDKSLEENKVKSYLLVQVNVDTTKALKTSAFIKNDDRSMRWLAFKYVVEDWGMFMWAVQRILIVYRDHEIREEPMGTG